MFLCKIVGIDRATYSLDRIVADVNKQVTPLGLKINSMPADDSDGKVIFWSTNCYAMLNGFRGAE
jgi:hypothetical protein